MENDMDYHKDESKHNSKDATVSSCSQGMIRGPERAMSGEALGNVGAMAALCERVAVLDAAIADIDAKVTHACQVAMTSMQAEVTRSCQTSIEGLASTVNDLEPMMVRVCRTSTEHCVKPMVDKVADMNQRLAALETTASRLGLQTGRRE